MRGCAWPKPWQASACCSWPTTAVVVVGDTLAQAFDDFYYLERACQVQILAMQTGQPLNVMPDAMAHTTHDQFARFTINADLHLEEIKRILDEQEPGYAS